MRRAGLRPDVRQAAIRALGRAGFDVVAPGEGCCGALVHHMGREHDALAAARNNVDVWTRLVRDESLTAIIVTASGWGTAIKNYGFMLKDDPAYAHKAARVSAMARDICEVLADHEVPMGHARPLRVAYHPACSLQHGQKVIEAVQIGNRTAIPIVHTIELLDWAMGGPEPHHLRHLTTMNRP